MNRVIKFRWWNSQRMVDGKDLNILLKNADNLDWLMQYTGLKDKNGVEIYEGDVLYIGYNLIGNREVKFEDGKFNIFCYSLGKCEVVGNIYQNPELIK